MARTIRIHWEINEAAIIELLSDALVRALAELRANGLNSQADGIDAYLLNCLNGDPRKFINPVIERPKIDTHD